MIKIYYVPILIFFAARIGIHCTVASADHPGLPTINGVDTHEDVVRVAEDWLPKPSAIKHNDSPLAQTRSHGSAMPFDLDSWFTLDLELDGQLIDHVWSGHPVGFGMLTARGHQFIAYYDAERRITVAGRKLEETDWKIIKPEGVPVRRRQRMSNITGWDSHNYLTLALDRDGCLHLSGNMHNDPLVYYRTRLPLDLASLERIDLMTGESERRVTYPRFFNHLDGRLLFRYRDGGSGSGSDLYNVYDPDAGQWRRLFDGPLLDGQGERSAYGTGPQPGPDGLYHMLWMWRDTPDAMTNHTLSYARSPDLINWETSGGLPVPRPITIGTGEVVDAAQPGEGLINMTFALGWDAKHRPVAIYHRYDATGQSQIYAARADGTGHWHMRQISDWTFRWEFPGGGSQVKQVSVSSPAPTSQGDLIVGYSTHQLGSGRWRLEAETFEVVEHMPAKKNKNPVPARNPRGTHPGLEMRSISSTYEGRRWELRWETLGINRDLEQAEAPPPAELRLYELPR